MKKIIIHGILTVVFAALLIKVYGGGDEGEDVFTRLGVTIVAGIYGGILFITFVLPILSDKMSNMVYGDPDHEEPEEDSMREARSLLAQGQYPEALEAFRQCTTKEPGNRFPWIEMAKIQASHLHNPQAAIETLTKAINNHDWPVNDAAFLMFRTSELYIDECNNTEAGIAILKQVAEMFPETRHAANATHHLRELNAL